MSTLSTRQRDLDFLEACKTKDCHVVRQFIFSGCDPILIQNEFGQNALHVASLHGNMDIVELLVKVYECDPEITDHNGRTALHLACMGGSIMVTEYLMTKGSCQLTDSSDNTLLHLACFSGDVPTVRYVMDVTTTNNCFSKLNTYRDETTIYMYEKAPADGKFIARQNNNRETALHIACRAGHLNVLHYFAEELEVHPCLCQILISVSKLACRFDQYDIFTHILNTRCSHTKSVSPTQRSNYNSRPTSLLHSRAHKQRKGPHFTPLRRSCQTGGKSMVLQRTHYIAHHPSQNWSEQYSLLPSDTFRDSVLKPSLSIACLTGNEEMVRHLIKDYKCDPLLPDSDSGDTPLHFAAISGNVSLVSFLLDCQCDPIKCNEQGNTPLHEACKWGNLEIVKKLIDAEPSAINASNQMMESPLQLACSRNRSHIGKLLVGTDSCDVMALNRSKEIPLHVASCFSNYELIECILNKNKDALKCADSYGDTPLFNACRVGNVNVVKLFMEAGCDPLHVNNTTCELPIHIACRTGNVALFQCLKKSMNSESWNQANIFGQTPLHLVCKQGNVHVVNDILEHAMCDVNMKDNRGMTPLHIACKKDNAEIVKAIMARHTVDVNIDDEDGNTPLHLACVNEDTDIVMLLMQYDPDITIRNENGDTPVHIACQQRAFKILSKVLGTRKHGVKFEFNKAGMTPLHIASISGHFEIVQYLVNGEYCDPNAISKQKHFTPLHFACFKGHKDIAAYLAKCAPQTVGVHDINGQSPVQLAFQKKNFDVIKFLVPHCFDPNSEISKTGIPLFLYSYQYGDLDLLKYLVSVAKCNTTLTSPQWGTAIHFIIKYFNPGEEISNKFLYVLDVCSSQIDCVDNEGNTPLLLACKSFNNKVVTLLLEHNANPNCKSSIGDFPLHIACEYRMFDMVKTLLHYKADVSCINSVGNTPLHISCGKGSHYGARIAFKNPLGYTVVHAVGRSGMRECVKLLLDHKASTSCKNSEGKTPIQVTTSYAITMMLIDYGANPQDVYTHYDEVLEKCKQEQPLHDIVKILIVGNALAGKTTLVEALKCKSIHVALVDHVAERTAGIVSTQFRSEKLGYVTFHDFAGQQEFYSSHSQFLVSNLSSDAIVLLLVNALDENSELMKNISYWMSFIKHHCSNVPQIVVICSHLDKLDDTKALKELAVKQAIQKYQCLGLVFLDCRDPASEGMCQLKDLLGGICDKVRSNIELDCQCHVLFAFMHSWFKDTVELGEVQRAIRMKRENVSYSRTHLPYVLAPSRREYVFYTPPNISYQFSSRAHHSKIRIHTRDRGDLLPHAASTLLNLLQTLHQKGHILLLNNENKEDQYWIVLKQDVFYETVHGTLFAPKNFEDNGPIRTNIGVVPLSVLMQVFCDHTTDLKLITKYLVYKEFCHKIDDPETLKLISSETNALMESDAELYFFPCFIKVEKPSAVWKRRDEKLYSSGWCLQCSDEHFFQTNFLHVLLLRLTFKYAVKHKDVPSASPFTRRCNLWKNGIYWSTTDGVEVLVELTHNFTFLLVLIRSLDTRQNVTMECVKLRASVIRTVFDVVQKTCPGLKPSESLIHCGLHDYPGCDLMSAEKISIKEAANSIKEGKAFSFSTNNETHILEDVLFFEPYSGMGEDLLSALYEKNEEEMPSDYVLKLSQLFSTRKDKLECVLNISPVDIGDIHAHQVCQKNPELIPHRVIEHWKISTRKGSYSDLREAFDRYSVFSGRNPLTLCN